MFCPNCGKQINNDDVFCAFCGATISAGGKAPQPPKPAPAPRQAAPKNQKAAPVQSYPNPAAAPKKKSGGCLVAAIIGIIAVHIITVLIVGIAVFLLTGKKGKNEGSIAGTPPPANSETLTGQTSASESTVPENDTPPTEPETHLVEEIDAYAEAMSYSTTDRPTLDEFEWTMNENGFLYAPALGEAVLTDPVGYSGGWKAMIVYNPTNAAGTYMRELDNVNIEVSGKDCTITIDWYYMYIEGSESYREDDMDDTTFTGFVTDTGLYASGAAEISLNYLWKDETREYALGTMIVDSIPAYVALVR